jgi:5-methylcytosine-specific restriction endonuclease McrA
VSAARKGKRPGTARTARTAAPGYATAADVRYRPRGGDNLLLRFVLYEQWRQRCYSCDEPQPFAAIDIDHILPRSLSDEDLAHEKRQHGLPADFDLNRPANLAPICKRCNRAKSNRRYTGLALTTKLAEARDKQDTIIRRVLAAAAAHQNTADALAALQSIRSPAEGLQGISMLTERLQTFSDTWRQDVATTPDGALILRYTPRGDGPVGLPPLFDLSAGGPHAAAVGRALAEVRDYGGELAVDARYLQRPAEPGEVSLAEVLGLTGPDDQVVFSSAAVVLGPEVAFHLALLTAGGAVRDRIPLHPDPAWVGLLSARMVLRDAGGVFTADVQVDRPAPGATTSTHLTFGTLAGQEPYRLLNTLGLFRAAEPTDRLDVRMNDRSLGESDPDDAADLGPLVTALRNDYGLVTAIARIQERTGDRFALPEHISPTEAAQLRQAARLLDGPITTTVSGPIVITLPPGDIDNVLSEVRSDGLRVWTPKHRITCGPHQIDLGPITYRAADVTVVNADELRAAAAQRATATARYQAPNGPTTVVLEFAPAGMTAEAWFATKTEQSGTAKVTNPVPGRAGSPAPH